MSRKGNLMRILAFIGSPRKGGNTDILTDEFLKGAETGGHTYEKIYLYKYDISPCIDCRKCKKDGFSCVLKDDMQEIYPKMDQTDLIIFGTPNYWYGPTAKMKLLVDRMRPYVANERLKGKKAVVISPAAEGANANGPLMEMFEMSLKYLEVEFAGKVSAEAYERGEIKNDREALKNAYELGVSF
jgi:multimeric flavodoxin WrbA